MIAVAVNTYPARKNLFCINLDVNRDVIPNPAAQTIPTLEAIIKCLRDIKRICPETILTIHENVVIRYTLMENLVLRIDQFIIRLNILAL